MNMIADMHCHGIPLVDDGADSMNEAIAMLEEEYKEGVRLIILTPHFRIGMFEVSRDIVEKRFLELKEALEGRFPDLQLFLGCEFHTCSDMLDFIVSDSRYRMNGSVYVLTEFSHGDDRNYIQNTINQLNSAGFQPVIAHIERYSACTNDPDFVIILKRMGALVQINADAVVGYDGIRIKRFVLKLVKNGLVDFVGSDSHNMADRSCHLLKCEKILLRKSDPAYVKKIMWDNVMDIVDYSRSAEHDL